MQFRTTITLVVGLSLCFPLLSCAPWRAAAQEGNQESIVVAGQYRQHSTYASAAPTVRDRSLITSEGVDAEDVYQAQIHHFFNLRDFDRLEKEAREARGAKVRFAGGVWKLYILYMGVTELGGGESATDATWTAHLASAKVWAAAKPESATAQIALAQTYINYAWFARGSGYSDSVTNDGWKLFGKRVETAKSILLKAARLKEKCPFWFEVMQHVALAQGWDKAEARELMEQAVLFEPRYYAYYREFAYYLEPKWYGEESEAGKFADEISNRVGGKEGAFLYFEIASLLTCQCGQNRMAMKYLSWPKIKQGYAALDDLYGVSNLKRNRYAYMASVVGDKTVAREQIAKIGENWVRETWSTHERYQAVANWADHQ